MLETASEAALVLQEEVLCEDRAPPSAADNPKIAQVAAGWHASSPPRA